MPILTHCEGGTGALEQLRAPDGPRRAAGHVALSHVDKVVDRGYHRELLATGAFAEYDQAFRWGESRTGRSQLLEGMVGEGLGDRIVLGMDAARQGYYRVYGGAPGLAWLLEAFGRADGRAGSRRVRPRRPVPGQPRPSVRLRGGSPDQPDVSRPCGRSTRAAC